jgi:hypothetical protein
MLSNLIKRFVISTPRRFLTVFYILLLIAVPFSLSLFDKLDSGGYDNKAGKFYESQQIEKKYFGKQESDIIISLESKTLSYDEPAFEEMFGLVLLDLEQSGLYKEIYHKDNLPSAKLISKEENATLILLNKINKDLDNGLVMENLDALREKYTSGDFSLYVGGGLAVTHNINKIVKSDVSKDE